MSNQSRNIELLTGMLLFSVFGLMVETIFTGIAASWSGSFKGGVSLLMIPVYSFSYLLGIYAVTNLANSFLFTWYIRLPLIIICIYAIEWFFGAAYKTLGLQPWHYEHGWASDFSNGNITLYFLPAWLGFAIIVIPVIRIIQMLSPTVASLVKSQARP